MFNERTCAIRKPTNGQRNMRRQAQEGVTTAAQSLAPLNSANPTLTRARLMNT